MQTAEKVVAASVCKCGKCGHDLKHHNLGECLWADKNGRFCRCSEFIPAKKGKVLAASVCKCGHDLKHHNLGDCLWSDKDGRFCPCHEFRPVKREMRRSANFR